MCVSDCGRACSLAYSACNTHALYSIVNFGLCESTIFLDILIYRTICGGEKKVVELQVSSLFFSTAFFILRRIQWDVIKVKTVFTYPLFLLEFNGALTLSTNFWKKGQISDIFKMRLCCSIRTDGHDKANYRPSQFFQRAWNRVASVGTPCFFGNFSDFSVKRVA